MQFVGKKGISLFVAIVAIACGMGFGSGLLIGRKFPAHTFQRFGDTRYLFDAATGKVCDPFKDPKASTNPFAHLTDQNGPSSAESPADPSSDPYAKYIVKPPSNYPPPCGK
jgi:hypothetical protein